MIHAAGSGGGVGGGCWRGCPLLLGLVPMARGHPAQRCARPRPRLRAVGAAGMTNSSFHSPVQQSGATQPRPALRWRLTTPRRRTKPKGSRHGAGWAPRTVRADAPCLAVSSRCQTGDCCSPALPEQLCDTRTPAPGSCSCCWHQACPRALGALPALGPEPGDVFSSTRLPSTAMVEHTGTQATSLSQPRQGHGEASR